MHFSHGSPEIDSDWSLARFIGNWVDNWVDRCLLDDSKFPLLAVLLKVKVHLPAETLVIPSPLGIRSPARPGCDMVPEISI